MDPYRQMTALQAGGSGIMMLRMFSCNTLSLLMSADTTLNIIVYLSIVAEPVRSFMTVMLPYGDGYYASFHCVRSISY